MAALQMRSEKRQGRRGLPGEPFLPLALLILLRGHLFCLRNGPDRKRSAHQELVVASFHLTFFSHQ